MNNYQALKPVCFMVMPFRQRRVVSARENAPAILNCDALWNKAYAPAIEAAGYTAIRADFDTGSVIIKDMIERLAFADLVLADVSLPNGNVYYEVGLRHAAHETGCILFAAEWSKQLFDIDQYRTIRYDLPSGKVTDKESEVVREVVEKAIANYAHETNPWHIFKSQTNAQQAFRKEAQLLSDFQAALRSISIEPDREKRKIKLDQKADNLKGQSALELPQVAVDMVEHLRDYGDWTKVLSFIDQLSAPIKALPFLQEQRLLALSYTGEDAEAIGYLEELIKREGTTPERFGLIGGRYKRLWRAAKSKREQQNESEPSLNEMRFLSAAIEAYEKGMLLDLNEYYCSCNLPALLLERDQSGDWQKAKTIDYLVIAACERALTIGTDNPWTTPTLLGSAFRAADIDKVKELAVRISNENQAVWMLDTTLKDIAQILDKFEEKENMDSLRGIYRQLLSLTQ